MTRYHEEWDEVFERLVRPFLGSLPDDAPLTGDIDMRAAGLSSLGTVQLLMRVEETYDVEFPDEELTIEVFTTPGALWKALVAVRERSV